jgi:hypothetical protein
VSSIYAQELQWRDASGRDYVLLDGLKTWNETERECGARGLAIFDARFISDSDRNSFLKSELFQNLSWEKIYGGTPREAAMANLWQASQVGTIVGGGELGSTVWVHLKRGDKLSSTQEIKSETARAANGVCMSVDSFWQRCTSEFKCTFNDAHSEWSWRYLFVDFGATENEAFKRIVERTEQPKWSVSEGKCGLVTSTMRCMRVLP